MQVSHRNKSDAVIPVAWSQDGASRGVRKTGKKECVSIMGSICCIPGNRGFSAGVELPAISPRFGGQQDGGSVYGLYL